MIPRLELELSDDLPADARYWMPPPDEVDFEGGTGIGFFQDVRLIINVAPDEAQQIAADEREILRIVDSLSPDGATFERLANLVEFYDPDDAESSGVGPAAFERLEQYLDEWSPLQGLELGVAGIAHALASVGCIPVASCRSHVAQYSWADRPVVYFAADEPHGRWLEPLVRQAGCGFAIDDERPDFLLLEAPSITEMTRLTAAILRESETGWPTWLSRTYEPVGLEVDYHVY
ncbi:hypothetical protein GA0074695_5877 [Micromonospora viridifaciens]|uniref:Uncharacterized protein n=2 Tax=Micromonospora viridifaciens TaxID=1881 RepID=A0A1C4ZPI6_MICVI|nr:hypothetical protein GA0074695_5877 [Micromonospora viridifaciens]